MEENEPKYYLPSKDHLMLCAVSTGNPEQRGSATAFSRGTGFKHILI